MVKYGIEHSKVRYPIMVRWKNIKGGTILQIFPKLFYTFMGDNF